MKTFPPCLLYFKSDRYYEEAAEKERKKKELEGWTGRSLSFYIQKKSCLSSMNIIYVMDTH